MKFQELLPLAKLKFSQVIKDILEHKFFIFFSLIALSVALVLNVFAGRYTDKVGTAISHDIILDNLPVLNLNFIYIWVAIAITSIMIFYVLFFRTNRFHIYLSHLSLLILVRNFAMCLTHLKTPSEAVYSNFPFFLNLFSFQNDLFFSGHVAYTFIGFLLFKDSKIKWLFLFSSIIMAVTVLLMHAHYSIDVFSAYFITYGTFVLGEKMFKRVFSSKKD
jgi:hypothetical protein